MSLYRVYFEVADDGLSMAHVPELPGCTVRAPSREEALRRLPDAIRAYLGWLKAHAEIYLGHDRHHAEDVRKAMGVAAIHD